MSLPLTSLRLSGHRPYQRLKRLLFATLLAVLFIVVCVVKPLRKFAVYYTVSFIPASINDSDRPPSYTNLREWEQNLPQHDLDLPFPEGKTGRYVLFSSSRVELLGWNNKLIMVLMDSWLAYKSNRTYVFHDFAWSDKHYPWPAHKFREWTPHTPLNALISGPSVGGAWEDGDLSPRAVSNQWFDVVCPKAERRYINTHDVKPAIYWEDGAVIFAHWQKILIEAPERCIEVVAPSLKEDAYPQIFDLYLWGSTRSLSLWEEFKSSPVSRLLTASKIVDFAIENNEPLFLPRGQRPLTTTISETPFDRVISIHIRRGDFKTKCRDFWTWSSTFYSWNLLPFLPDRFDPPPGSSWGGNTEENLPIYIDRCYPEIPALLDKVKATREGFVSSAQPGELAYLDTVYIMTNDRTPWLDDLKAALKADGWRMVITSNDLTLNAEQKDVGMAIDMEIGRRSAVFIGNGWSSFSSNVVHQRLVDGREPISIRFL
ncbi:hypothetical protein GALMADRAFT_237765 [Galerina marginata CBS 339.88]|uniref:Uncharacterized protein n=1 Tax=Galerina marginata (strain CBS 339.88) TaxID=685588 RepID=A0A067TGY7_GALM3|nr:hypothetical protein GALMADRAFT_237765 [Galerina marginata CBS 339.88]